MKKSLVLLLSAVLTLGITGCSNNNSKVTDNTIPYPKSYDILKQEHLLIIIWGIMRRVLTLQVLIIIT